MQAEKDIFRMNDIVKQQNDTIDYGSDSVSECVTAAFSIPIKNTCAPVW